jgi:hypothetical protein
MNIRPLIIDAAARAKTAAVVAWAMDHHLDSRNPTFIPGNDPHFTALLGSYRTVFTFTRDGEALFRHLSVSVPMPGRYPNPIAVWMIADLYGFTGWSPEMGVKIPPDWMPQVREYSAQVLQPVKTH